MLDGRLEIGLVGGIVPEFFTPFEVDFESRRAVTLDFVGLLKVAYSDADHFDFAGRFHQFEGMKFSVDSVQRPHPPIWIETRDPPTLEFCATHGIHTGYFILHPRDETARRYRDYLARWNEIGWPHKPNIAYSTVVYVDETDDRALDVALQDAGRAYRGFFPPTDNAAELKAEQYKRAAFFDQKGEPAAGEIMRHLLDPDYLLENDLILIGSPETVTQKLEAYARSGMFNTFFGEFNFGDIADEDLMRSIRLFGTEVMPRLREFEPF